MLLKIEKSWQVFIRICICE